MNNPTAAAANGLLRVREVQRHELFAGLLALADRTRDAGAGPGEGIFTNRAIGQGLAKVEPGPNNKWFVRVVDTDPDAPGSMSPVEWMAPETKPSASPIFTIITP